MSLWDKSQPKFNFSMESMCASMGIIDEGLEFNSGLWRLSPCDQEKYVVCKASVFHFLRCKANEPAPLASAVKYNSKI